MLYSTIILILVVLSLQVLPVALGISPGKEAGKTIWFGLILVLGQILFLWFGLLLGDRFMHLVSGFSGVVVFVGFFLIGIKMMMDTFKVRKGERTFSIDNSLQVILASSAQGINTFLAGVLLTLYNFDTQWISIILLISTAVVVVTGMFLKPEKQTLVFTSLLFAVGGFIMLISSIYLGFIF